MLRNSDIIHGGLKDIHATGTTLNSAPPVHLVRRCARRLQALGLAKSIPSNSFLGITVVALPNTTGHPTYEMPVNSNKITFGWNASYAVQVDWV